MRVIWAAACWIVAATGATAAIDRIVDRPTVDAAVALGQSRGDRDRMRYHAAYRAAVDKPPLDYIEVVTRFRRIVLEAESRARTGDRTFGQRQAIEVLASMEHGLEIHAEFTLHPLNNFVGVPDYVIRLERAGPVSGRLQTAPTTHAAVRHDRIPRFGARVEGAPSLLPVPGGIAPGESQPLLGGTVIAYFDEEGLNPTGLYDVVVEEAGKDLARVRLDFGTMR